MLVNLTGKKTALQIIWLAVFLRRFIFMPDRTAGIPRSIPHKLLNLTCFFAEQRWSSPDRPFARRTGDVDAMAGLLEQDAAGRGANLLGGDPHLADGAGNAAGFLRPQSPRFRHDAVAARGRGDRYAAQYRRERLFRALFRRPVWTISRDVRHPAGESLFAHRSQGAQRRRGLRRTGFAAAALASIRGHGARSIEAESR